MPELDTRSSILRVAIEAFGRDGFAATSLVDIAAQAHVTKGAVYHYFGSKEALFRAVRDEVEKATIEASREAADVEGGPVDHIKAGIRAFLAGAVHSNAQRILFIDAPVVLNDRPWPLANKGMEELQATIEIASREGWIRKVEPTAMAAVIAGACQAGARVVAAADDPDAMRDHVVDSLMLLIDGLVPTTTA